MMMAKFLHFRSSKVKLSNAINGGAIILNGKELNFIDRITSFIIMSLHIAAMSVCKPFIR